MNPELVGLIPAAGRASRLGSAAGSKEVLPIGWRDTASGRRPILACDNLLAAYRLAGCARGVVLRRREKGDIEDALGDGTAHGLHLEYVIVPPTRSVPETLTHAAPCIADADVALGFPDVLAEPTTGLASAVAHRRSSGADVVLALFPTDRPEKCDMVETDAAGRVVGIEIKPRTTDLAFTWLFATWGPEFTRLLLELATSPAASPPGRELAVSDILLAGVARRLRVEAVACPEGSHLDIGTPEDLARTRTRLSF